MSEDLINALQALIFYSDLIAPDLPDNARADNFQIALDRARLALDKVDPEPFATFTHAGIVDRVLIDKIARVVRDHVNRHDKDFCNVKITFEDWDC